MESSYLSGVTVLFGSNPQDECPAGWEVVELSTGGRKANLNKGGTGAFLAVQRVRFDIIDSPPAITNLVVVLPGRGEVLPPGYRICSENLNRGKYGDEVVLGFEEGPRVSVCGSPCKSVVLDRYPCEDCKGFPFPQDQLPMFSFPQGLQLVHRPDIQLGDRSMRSPPPKPEWLPLVWTNVDGKHNYSACLMLYEALPLDAVIDLGIHAMGRIRRQKVPRKEGSKNRLVGELLGEPFEDEALEASEEGGDESSVGTTGSSKVIPPIKRCPSSSDSIARDATLAAELESRLAGGTVFAPKALCIMSIHPVYASLKELLTHLFYLSQHEQGQSKSKSTAAAQSTPIIQMLKMIVGCMAMPCPGGRSISLLLPSLDQLPAVRVNLTAPHPCWFPLMDDEVFLAPFNCLSLQNVIAVFGLMVQEAKVLFLGSDVQMLTQVMEALRSLLFPLQWQSLYVPRLPMTLRGCLDAPGGYLIGMAVEREDLLLGTQAALRLHNLDSYGITSVNLDTDEVLMPSGLPYSKAFAAEARKGSTGGLPPRGGGGNDLLPLPAAIATPLKAQLAAAGVALLADLPDEDGAAPPPPQSFRATSPKRSGASITAFLNKDFLTPMSKTRGIKKSFKSSFMSGGSSSNHSTASNTVSSTEPSQSLPRTSGSSQVDPAIAIRDAFLGAMAAMFGHVGQHCLTVREDGKLLDLMKSPMAELFQTEQFLQDFPAAWRTYMKSVSSTQMFWAMVQSRFENSASNYQLVFFEECVKVWGERQARRSKAQEREVAGEDSSRAPELLVSLEVKKLFRQPQSRVRRQATSAFGEDDSLSGPDSAKQGSKPGSPTQEDSDTASASSDAPARHEMKQLEDELLLLDSSQPPLEVKLFDVECDADEGAASTVAGMEGLGLEATDAVVERGVTGWPDDLQGLGSEVVLPDLVAKLCQYAKLRSHESAGFDVTRLSQDLHVERMLGRRSFIQGKESIIDEALGAYSSACALWLLSLPSIVDTGEAAVTATLLGLGIVRHLQSISAPIDESMWRTLLVSCGRIGGDLMQRVAAALFAAMRDMRITANAVTYGLYTKALSEPDRKKGLASLGEAYDYIVEQGLLWIDEAIGKSSHNEHHPLKLGSIHSSGANEAEQPPSKEDAAAEALDLGDVRSRVKRRWSAAGMYVMDRVREERIAGEGRKRKRVVGMWSELHCPCSHVLLDEEIMACWKDFSSTELKVSCPKCDARLSPELHYQYAYDERACSSSDDDKSCRQSGNSSPAFSPLSPLSPSPKAESFGSQVKERAPSLTFSPSPKVSASFPDDMSSSYPEHGCVVYLSPMVLRKEMERLVINQGEDCLTVDWVKRHERHLFWNLVWLVARLGLPLPLKRSKEDDEDVVVCGWSKAVAMHKCGEASSDGLMRCWTPAVTRLLSPPLPLDVLFPAITRSETRLISMVLARLSARGAQGVKDSLLVLRSEIVGEAVGVLAREGVYRVLLRIASAYRMPAGIETTLSHVQLRKQHQVKPCPAQPNPTQPSFQPHLHAACMCLLLLTLLVWYCLYCIHPPSTPPCPEPYQPIASPHLRRSFLRACWPSLMRKRVTMPRGMANCRPLKGTEGAA
ncbi:unnamed protein product [Chrysoparadoxa australica]